MNTTKIMTFLAFLAFLATACFKAPQYADTPAIVFESIRNAPTTGGDSVIIVFSYQDGNGDLGLDESDKQPPFQELNSDGSVNPAFFNFYANAYKKINGRYVPIIFSKDFTLNGRIPRLNKTRSSAIEGTIRYGIRFEYLFSSEGVYSPPVFRNDTIKFDVQIADRGLNKSNIVQTSEIIIGRKN